MKISLVLPTLATNGTLRAWVIAQLLSRHYEVEAIGLLREGEKIFPWVGDYAWQPVAASGVYDAVTNLERAITGDIAFAYGAGLCSFGACLLAKRRRGVPVILDMPEWEVHEHHNLDGRISRALMVARHLIGPGWSNPHSFKYRYVLDHLTRLADERTCGCSFVQRRYGGDFLPFCADTAKFDPTRFDKTAVRRKWGIPADAAILFFGGNPQPMKGLEETVAAIHALDGTVDARLVIVGRDETHAYTRKVKELARGKAIVLGAQPFTLMPELLSMADIVALPDTRVPKSMGYIPAKIYEAMAMAIPVIASDLSDMPVILKDCGYIIPPDDSSALRAQIEYVLLHPDEAREMGRRARQRAIEHYSWDVGERVLHGVVERVIGRMATRQAA
jgi:glycosyltransferase involved in cell wall biosynthesis